MIIYIYIYMCVCVHKFQNKGYINSNSLFISPLGTYIFSIGDSTLIGVLLYHKMAENFESVPEYLLSLYTDQNQHCSSEGCKFIFFWCVCIYICIYIYIYMCVCVSFNYYFLIFNFFANCSFPVVKMKSYCSMLVIGRINLRINGHPELTRQLLLILLASQCLSQDSSSLWPHLVNLQRERQLMQLL